ncbi:hypothetical protein SEA_STARPLATINUM_77 [Streptomyces phage StarPlatinum]|uniref:Uncharacterized protein n=1 Tax=Streptomyces phage StarPlatinum TaxID=2283265 RepID=A0A345M8K4_9CAUD|nr:hypothetical protein HWB77_gp212 [Streptomyces phage StarPlatinum]AXH66825.1 hypothetical protein SEA_STARPLATINUM_77 [Streptomyces phage StarPlatinum]
MNQREQSWALITLYKRLYKKRYGIDSTMNSYSAQWNFQAILKLKDLSYQQLRDVIEYYFTCDANGHSIDTFFNKYMELNRMRLDLIRDAEKRKQIMAETAERVRRMEERANNSGEAN